jgi:hypothetical protein
VLLRLKKRRLLKLYREEMAGEDRHDIHSRDAKHSILLTVLGTGGQHCGS